MANLVLDPKPRLGGLTFETGGTVLTEETGLAIVAVATPLKGGVKLKAAIKKAYDASMPSSMKSTLSKNKKTRIVFTQPDQIFVLFDHAKPDAEAVVAKKIGATGYVTDQTDGWIALTLEGPLARAALERLSMVDLSADAFARNASARTPMEHMGAMVIRTGQDAFLLMSASSSAESFAHAIETSMKYVS